MNLQNKIVGRSFAVLGVNQNYYDGVPKYVPSDIGVQWRLESETLDQYEIGDKTLDDIVEQIKDFGTLEELRRRMGIPSFAGYHNGPVLRHRERPDVTALVTVTSGPRVGYNPNVYGSYNSDLIIEFFLDVDRQNSENYREIESEMNIISALSHSGIGRYATIEHENLKEVEVKESATPFKVASEFYEEIVTEVK